METGKEINIWKVGEKKNAEEKEGKYLVSGGEETQNRKKEENNWSAEKEGDEREVICHKFEASCKLCT